MKMRFKTVLSALVLAASSLLLMASSQRVHAQQAELASLPGYVDFNEVSGWFDAPANIEVNLRGTLLDLISSSTEDSEFSQLMSGLQAIQARGYPMPSGTENEVMAHVQELSSQLESDGWERVVSIRDEGETLYIYAKPDGDSIAGLTVMMADPSERETMFVNIVGSIRPEEIGKIGRGLDIEPLQNVDTSGQQD